MSKDIAEIISDGYDIFLQGRLRHDKVEGNRVHGFNPNDLTHFYYLILVELNGGFSFE